MGLDENTLIRTIAVHVNLVCPHSSSYRCAERFLGKHYWRPPKRYGVILLQSKISDDIQIVQNKDAHIYHMLPVEHHTSA